MRILGGQKKRLEILRKEVQDLRDLLYGYPPYPYRLKLRSDILQEELDVQRKKTDAKINQVNTKIDSDLKQLEWRVRVLEGGK